MKGLTFRILNNLDSNTSYNIKNFQLQGVKKDTLAGVSSLIFWTKNT